MKEFKFLVWTSGLALTEEKMSLVQNSMKKASAIIEKEINSSKGICNKPVHIIYKHFPKGEEGVNQIADYLNSNQNIIATNGHHMATHNENLLKKINLNNFLYFDNHGQARKISNNHNNHFIISPVTKEGKLKYTNYFIKNVFKNGNCFFFHDKKRFYTEIIDIVKNNKINIKDFDVSDISNESDAQKILNPILDAITDNDLILLDTKFLNIKYIFDYLNTNDKKTTVIKYFGSIDNRFDLIKFPLIEIGARFDFPTLSYESLCNKINISLSAEEKKLIFDSIFRIEVPLLISYVSKLLTENNLNKQEYLIQIYKKINSVDGVNDIFIGKSRQYGFKNNLNVVKLNFVYTFPNSLQKSGQISRIFYPIQFLPINDNIIKTYMNYAYIDIIRVTNIDIGESIWSCEFFLDIVTIHDNPLEIINFNNLSLLNSKFESKLVTKTNDKNFGFFTYRYYIVANFDFLAIADNYPFDWQHIYISLSMSNQEKYGILQPVPEALLDYDFQLDGWRLTDAKTGVLRKKETHHQNTTLDQVIHIREEVRVGWTIARTNVVTTMKVAIPIIFLMFLNYYTTFLPFNEASSSIGILTTTFLSGIALYFSTEKPQPLRMTTIDLIFIYYYLQVGISVVITSITGFSNEDIYNYAMLFMKFALPISMILAFIFLYRRIKSVRLKPRID